MARREVATGGSVAGSRLFVEKWFTKVVQVVPKSKEAPVRNHRQVVGALKKLGLNIPHPRDWETDGKPGERFTQVTTGEIVLHQNREMDAVVVDFVSDIIAKLSLRVYILMVSHDGRGDKALYTGSAIFQRLKDMGLQDDFQFVLSYQGSPRTSKLCQKLQEMGVRIIAVDPLKIIHPQTDEIVVDTKARGKAENLIKALMAIAKEEQDPSKVFVVVLDDDYTLQEPTNIWAMVAPWVLSRVHKKEVPDSKILPLWQKCCGVGFTKGGSSRLHLPDVLMQKIIEGYEPVLNYRRLIQWVLAEEFTSHADGEEAALLKSISQAVSKIPPQALVTPVNLWRFIGRGMRKKYEDVTRRYVRLGGRVSTFLREMFTYQSEDVLWRALAEFTFLLHGDQGATLENWRKLCIGRRYALEITFLIQALMDVKFRGQNVCNVVGIPHAHQPQPDEAIWEMKNQILFLMDLMRLLFGLMEPTSFSGRHGKDGATLYRYLESGRVYEDGKQRRKSALTIIGRIDKGMPLYPPLEDLTIA